MTTLNSLVRTFRPRTAAYSSLKRHIDATLGSGNLRQAVRLPPGEDLNEWLAVNTVDFYNAISMLYGTLNECCTAESCPTMCAGPKYEYRWADGVKVKKPIECSAPVYVFHLMEWVESVLDDQTVFPQQPQQPFPRGFQDVVRTIFKRLFRVYAHIYHAHWDLMVSLGAEAHLNTCFKHFLFFTQAFELIDSKELAPLKEIIDTIGH